MPLCDRNVEFLIQDEMLAGKNSAEITRMLNALHIPTPSGRDTWDASVVNRICRRTGWGNEPSFDDPAEVYEIERKLSRVQLVCHSCEQAISYVADLFHHTWQEHGRVPSRKERTPIAEEGETWDI